jgi:hypothetical protein
LKRGKDENTTGEELAAWKLKRGRVRWKNKENWKKIVQCKSMGLYSFDSLFN